MSMLEIIS